MSVPVTMCDTSALWRVLCEGSAAVTARAISPTVAALAALVVAGRPAVFIQVVTIKGWLHLH